MATLKPELNAIPRPVRAAFPAGRPAARQLLASCSALILILSIPFLAGTQSKPRTVRWSEQSANEWYASQPWLVGSNYIPATAINQLEMWQADTFDPKRI
ncbi:MAG: hypothetical protein WBQ12_05900, partial [Candidatus Sulfotelmatobacter sp.]